MGDADLDRALAAHRRALALLDDEEPDPIIRESTRDYLNMLIEDAEAEDARRQRCVALGIPRDASRYPADFLASIKSAVKLDELLAYESGARLGKLNSRGIRRGPCPFCRTSEHSTSLVVSVGEADNQWWYCFVGLHGGDCFQAIMQAYGMEFPQAVEKLARDGGFALPAKPKPTPPPASGPKKTTGLLVLHKREN